MTRNDSELGKGTRRRLRELAAKAYEAELGSHLDGLLAAFGAWKRGEFSAGELSERVHEYHHGPARDVYLVYSRMKPDRLVARAVAVGVLEEEELEGPLAELLGPEIDALRELARDSDESTGA